MTPADKEVFQRGIAKDWVTAAIDADLFTLPDDMGLDEFVAGIQLVQGVPSQGPAPTVATRPDRCLLCSQNFQTVDRHPVCWLCRSQTREEYAS